MGNMATFNGILGYLEMCVQRSLQIGVKPTAVLRETHPAVICIALDVVHCSATAVTTAIYITLATYGIYTMCIHTSFTQSMSTIPSASFVIASSEFAAVV